MILSTIAIGFVALVCSVLGFLFGGAVNFSRFGSSPAPIGVLVLFVAAATTAVVATGALSVCAVAFASLLFGLMGRGAAS